MTDPMRFASGRLRRGLALLLALSLPAQAGAVALERVVAPAHFHVAAGGPAEEHEPDHHHPGIDHHAHEADAPGVVAVDDGGAGTPPLIDQPAVPASPALAPPGACASPRAAAPPACFDSRAPAPPVPPPRRG